MEATSIRRRWTYAEFARLPSDGSKRHEIIDGKLYVTPSPSSGHQRVVMRLLARLHPFVQEHGLGEVFPGPLDILFAEGDYVEPDVLFVRSRNAGLISDRGVEGPPDLIIEVVSPSTSTRDRGIKLERYRHYGVPEYWVVDAEAGTVEVWRFADGADEPDAHDSDDLLRWAPADGAATLEIDVGELFRA